METPHHPAYQSHLKNQFVALPIWLPLSHPGGASRPVIDKKEKEKEKEWLSVGKSWKCAS